MKNRIVIHSSSGEGIEKLVGLGYKIISYEDFKVEEDTLYLCIGYDAFKVVQDNVHLGLRNTKWSYCVDLPRVGIAGGTSFIFTYESGWYLEDAIKRFNDPNIDVPLIPLPPKPQYVSATSEAIKVLDRLSKLPDDQLFGYDYESNGTPNEYNFLLSGLGISTETESYWFEFRLMDDINRFYKEGLIPFLIKKGENCIVFNVTFEYMSTYRIVHKFIRFIDLNLINVINSRGPWMNFKWTARKICNVNSWDDDFDTMSDDIDYYIKDGVVDYDNLIPYLKKDYNLTDEECDEVRRYLSISPVGFYGIPMRILGKYCCLDAYYTLMSYKLGCKDFIDWNLTRNLKDYAYELYNSSEISAQLRDVLLYNISEHLDELIINLDLTQEIDSKVYDKVEEVRKRCNLCFEVYKSGKILEARINNQGMVKNTEFWNYSIELGQRCLLQFGTALTRLYYNFCLHWVGDGYKDLSKYNEYTAKMIREGIDFSWGGFYLSKYLFGTRYYSDKCDYYLDTNKVYEDWGQEIGDKLIDMLWECVDSNYNVGRKRSVHTYIGEYLDTLVFKPKEIDDETHNKTIQYYQYEKNYRELSSMEWVGKDYLSFNDSHMINGEEYSDSEALNYVTSYINPNSPDNKNWLWEFWNEHYLMELIFIDSKTYEYDTELQGRYPSDKIKAEGGTITDFPEIFKQDFEFFCDHFDELNQEAKDRATEINNDYSYINWPEERLLYQRWLWQYHYPGLREWLINAIHTGYIDDGPIGSILFPIYYRMYNKYFKSIGTYFKGYFYDSDENYYELDENWMTVPHNKPWDPNVPSKSFAYYTANKQYSLRWSSNFHTVPSLSEVKKCMGTTTDSLMGYIDISSAEVRTAAYLSKDPALVGDFESGKDVYINTASMAFPESDVSELYEVRGSFKTVLLGLIYGRGINSIASEIGQTYDETARLVNTVKERSATLYEYIEQKSNYPSEHEWYLDTILGEKIETDNYGGIDRRHGINTVIQNFSAVILVYGFENLFRHTEEEHVRLAPIAIVHDSITNMFGIENLWELQDYYYRHIEKFLYDITGVRYKFDIKLGDNYFDVCKLKQLSPDCIELKGSGDALNKIMNKLDKNNIKYRAESDDLVNGRFELIKHDPVEEFILYESREPIYDKDVSEYKLKLYKL